MENKDKKYTIRMTESEKKILEQEAINKNMKLSEYVRMKLLKENTIAIAPTENDIKKELEKIKEKYIIEKFNEKNPFEGSKLLDKINTLDEVINKLVEK